MIQPTGAGGVRPATSADVESWLSLAAEVEPLFGPMPGLVEHVRRGIGRGTALVTGPPGAITGAMLLSRDDRPHHIRWLAVRSSARGGGLGSALVAAAVARWPVGDIDVVTFTAHLPGGLPARRLYERAGFTCAGPTEPAPDGGPRDLFVLRR